MQRTKQSRNTFAVASENLRRVQQIRLDAALPSPHTSSQHGISTLSQRWHPRSDWNGWTTVSQLPCAARPQEHFDSRPFVPHRAGSSSSSPRTPTSKSTLSAPLPALLDRRTRTPSGGSRRRLSPSRSRRLSSASASRASSRAAISSSLGWTVM